MELCSVGWEPVTVGMVAWVVSVGRLVSWVAVGVGMTVGRGLNGFLTLKFDDKTLIRLGAAIIGLGAGAMLLPGDMALAGLLLVGLGCAPVYPCIIHSTPAHFGEENSQALIGVQMASAYVGICCMPPLFGLLANAIGVFLLPWYTGAILLVMVLMCGQLNRKSG